MNTVAALYVDPRGPYPKMAGVDAWDEARDARLYAGPHPVVAHPPCGPWGSLAAFCRHQDADLAIVAVDQVRRFGGVLEHPAGSRLFRECRLPRPGELPDEHGGWTLSVNQVDFGHVAAKPTWLYILGVSPSSVKVTVPRGTPTHWICGSRKKRKPGARSGGVCPDTLKFCSAEQRRRTPQPFADFLVGIARGAVVERRAA